MKQLLLAIGTAIAVVLLGSASWADHTPAPVPSLAPGETVVPTGHDCHGVQATADAAGARETQDTCRVAGWHVQPAPPPVEVQVSQAPVTVEMPNPLAVQEVSPQPTTAGGLDQDQADDLDRLANYVPAVGAVVGFLLAVGIGSGLRR